MSCPKHSVILWSRTDQLLKHNQIPGFRLDLDWRFDLEEIDRWRLKRDKPGT